MKLGLLITFSSLVCCQASADECSKQCPSDVNPVCATDGLYKNQCELDVAACKSKGEFTNKPIKWEKCRFYHCRKLARKGCPANVNHICGSDGHWYFNECILFAASCYRKQGPINTAPPTTCPQGVAPIQRKINSHLWQTGRTAEEEQLDQEEEEEIKANGGIS